MIADRRKRVKGSMGMGLDQIIVSLYFAPQFAQYCESKPSDTFAALHDPAPFGPAGSNPGWRADQEKTPSGDGVFSWRTRPDLNRRSPP